MKEISKQNFLIFLILYASLILGFYFGENSSRGAYPDFNAHLRVMNELNFGFRHFFLNYADFNYSHSPIWIVFLSIINKLSNIDITRFIFLHISILIPILFYFNLKLKYNDLDKNKLFCFSLIIFISPYFRSLSIWPGDENLALVFFLGSIFYFFKYEKKLTKINLLLHIIFLASASYLRPNYCFFSVFFFFNLFFNKKKENLFFYILLNIILSLPAFYYIFFLNVIFFVGHIENLLQNILNSVVFTVTIIFFYYIPFSKINDIKLISKNNYKLIISIFISLFFIYFFNYTTPGGGGIFYHFSKFISDTELIFFIIFIISIIYLINFFQINILSNFILLLTLIFLDLDNWFYQETFDPLLIILFALLFKIRKFEDFFNILTYKKIRKVYLFLFIFLIINYSVTFKLINI
jgi:hypothetical protein